MAVAEQTKSGVRRTAPRLLDREGVLGGLLVLPALVVVVLFLVLPIVLAFAMAFMRIDLTRSPDWTFFGLGNFLQIPRDPVLFETVPRTLYFAFLSTAVTLVAGVALALFLNEPFRGQRSLRIIALLPWAVAPIATGVTWKLIFHFLYGLLNAILFSAGLIPRYVGWLEDEFLAFHAAVLAYGWLAVPFVSLILLARLQSIPEPLLPRVDGRRSEHLAAIPYVTMPGIRGTPDHPAAVPADRLDADVRPAVLPHQGWPGRRNHRHLDGHLQPRVRRAPFRLCLRAGAAVVPADDPRAWRSVPAGAAGGVARTRWRARPRRTSRREGAPLMYQSAARRSALMLCAIVLLIWTLLPLVWLMLVAILPGVELGNQPPIIDLTHASIDQFGTLLADDRFGQAMLNSLLAAGGTTIVTVVIASLAAYAISRLEMRGRNAILGGTLATQMVPGIVLVIPVFIIMRQVKLTDTILALILLYTTFLLPYAIWLLQNFFNHVPKSLESAARMDGCSRVGTLFQIILPVSAPGIAATAIFVFISSWNEFLFALVVTSQNATTVTIRLAQLQSTIFGGTDFATVGTAAVLMVLPVLLIVVIFNRYIAYGLTEGAVRG